MLINEKDMQSTEFTKNIDCCKITRDDSNILFTFSLLVIKEKLKISRNNGKTRRFWKKEYFFYFSTFFIAI